MSDPKIEAIQRMYAAFGRGDTDAILTDVAADIDWAIQASSTSAPWYGSYLGKSEVPRFFAALASSVEVIEFTPLSFTSNDTDVMATVRWTFKSIATGKTGTETLHHWWRFDNGKIVFCRGTGDGELTAEVFS